jgi:hypothetical protein
MSSKSRKNSPFRRVDSKIRRAALALSEASIQIFYGAPLRPFFRSFLGGAA